MTDIVNIVILVFDGDYFSLEFDSNNILVYSRFNYIGRNV